MHVPILFVAIDSANEKKIAPISSKRPNTPQIEIK